jgi:hypothetical protein
MLNVINNLRTIRARDSVLDSVGINISDRVLSSVEISVLLRVDFNILNSAQDSIKSNLESPERIPLSIMSSALRSTEELHD